jgi:hypothetical protein
VFHASVHLLAEARKSWQHVFADEIVYLLDSLNPNLDAFTGIAKTYIDRKYWIECHFELSGRWNGYYAALIGFGNGCPRRQLKGNVGGAAADWDSPVLVDVAHLVEHPKHVSGKGFPIKSDIWLKRFDERDSFAVYSARVASEAFSSFGGVLIEDRKLCPIGVGEAILGEVVDGLIECGPQAIKDISSDQVNPAVGFTELDPDSVNLIFNIILGRDDIGFRVREMFDRCLQFLKVVFRPFGLPIGFNQSK